MTTRHRVKLCDDTLVARSVNSIAISLDGRFAAITDSCGNLVIIDCVSGEVSHRATLRDGVDISAIAWAPEHELFYGRSDGQVASLGVVVSPGQATLETSTWLPYVIGSSKRVKSLAYDASRGGHLAVGVAGMAAVFRRRGTRWELVTSLVARAVVYSGSSFRTASDNLVSLAFLKDGNILLAYENGLRVWDVGSGKATIVQSDLPEEKIFSMESSPDGVVIISQKLGSVSLGRLRSQPQYTFVTAHDWPITQQCSRPVTMYAGKAQHWVAASSPDAVVVTSLIEKDMSEGINILASHSVISPGLTGIVGLAIGHFNDAPYTVIAAHLVIEDAIRIEVRTSSSDDWQLRDYQVQYQDLSVMLARYVRACRIQQHVRILLYILCPIALVVAAYWMHQTLMVNDVRYAAATSLLSGQTNAAQVQDLVDAGWLPGIPSWYSAAMVRRELARHVLGI